MKTPVLIPLLFSALTWAHDAIAQLDDPIFQDRYEPQTFVYDPDAPLDVLFYCELFYTDTGTPSQNRYYFDFALNGDLQGGFTLDTGDFVTVNGSYTVANGPITLTATNGLGADFSMTTDSITPRLGMVGFFTAIGSGLGRPARLACIAIGHGYDTATEQEYHQDRQVFYQDRIVVKDGSDLASSKQPPSSVSNENRRSREVLVGTLGRSVKSRRGNSPIWRVASRVGLDCLAKSVVGAG